MRRTSFLLILTMLITAPASVSAQEPVPTPRLESLVPGDSFLLLSLNDVPACRAQFSRTALAKLWREEEVQQFLAPALDMLRGELAKAERQLGHPISELLDFLGGQVGLAVVEIDPQYGGLVPDAVLLADLGEKRAAFQEFQASALERAGPNVGVKNLEHSGVAYQVMALPGGLEVAVGYLGNALVITSRPERMTAVIDTHAGKITNPLSANPVFKTVKARTGGDGAFLSAFFNAEAVLSHFGDRLPPLATQIVDAAGVSGIKGLGMSSSFVAEGIRDSFFAYVPGEKKGLLKLFYTSPGDGTGLLGRVPASAFYASAARIDLDEVVSIVLEAIAEVNPGIAEQARGYLGQADQMLGLSIRDDLLKPFGEEMAIYAALPDGGGVVPDIVFLTRLRDPQKFLNALGHLVERAKTMVGDDARLDVEHRKMAFRGKTIHYLNVSHGWGDPFPVTPCFVLDGDVLAAALFPQTLKDIIARGSGGSKLADRPDFMRVRRGLPEGLVSLEYIDLQAATRLLYGSLAPILQAVGKERNVPVDVALMPRTETIAQHMFGGAWGAKLAEDGVEWHGYTPFGLMPMMAVMAAPALLLARSGPIPGPVVALPELPPPPKPAPPRAAGSTRAQLEEIYSGLLFFYLEKGDSYPADLGALVTQKVVGGKEVLVAAGDGAPLPTTGGFKTSFVYVGPAVGNLMERQEDAVWVYLRDGLAVGSRWALFADGSVRRLPEDRFQALLSETRRRIAK